MKVKYPFSEIDGIVFSYPLSNTKTYIKQNHITGIKLLKFRLKIWSHYILAYIRLLKTIYIDKECFYGPFKGEFGHFLAHNLPFLMYLHRRGVKIHYCGMELHKPFLVDEQRKSIIHKWYPLRDFFSEVPPSSNSVIPPQDVQEKIDAFYQVAKKSKKPLWDINDDFYYWFIHRFFTLKFSKNIYNLKKAYQSDKRFSCVIFARGGKKVSSILNNGEPWDYQKIIDIISPFFDKIYVCGHPAQSIRIEPTPKTELRITSDNAKIIEACANSNLIITQHSGAVYLGNYTHSKVMIIYNGGNQPSNIHSLNNTLYFKKHIGAKNFPFIYAFSYEDIKEKVKTFKTNLTTST